MPGPILWWPGRVAPPERPMPSPTLVTNIPTPTPAATALPDGAAAAPTAVETPAAEAVAPNEVSAVPDRSSVVSDVLISISLKSRSSTSPPRFS